MAQGTPIRSAEFGHEGERYRVREQGGELTVQTQGRTGGWESLASGRVRRGVLAWRDLDEEPLQAAAADALRGLGVLPPLPPAPSEDAPAPAPPKKRGHIHCSRCGRPDHTVRNCPKPNGAPLEPFSPKAPVAAPGPVASAVPARGPFVVRPDGSVECPTLEDALALMKRLREENRG